MIGIVAAALFFGSIAFIAVQASRAACNGVLPAPDGPPPSKPPDAVLTRRRRVAGRPRGRAGRDADSDCDRCARRLRACRLLVQRYALRRSCRMSSRSLHSALLLVFALTQRNWGLIFSALVVFVPFAGAAAFSRGYGMGWGDAKLVAIVGAALGAPLAVFALFFGCAAAVVGHRVAGWPSPPHRVGAVHRSRCRHRNSARPAPLKVARLRNLRTGNVGRR